MCGNKPNPETNKYIVRGSVYFYVGDRFRRQKTTGKNWIRDRLHSR